MPRKALCAIGVDLGMVTTAIAYIHLDGSAHLTRIDRPPTTPFANVHMLMRVRAELSRLLAPPEVVIAHPLVVIACERIAHLRGAQAEPLIAWEWAVREAVLGSAPQAVSRLLLLPTGGQLKLFVSGRGNTDKNEIGRWIVHHWPQAEACRDDADGRVRMLTSDEIEAFALAQFARCRYQAEAGMISRQAPGPWTHYQVDMAMRDMWSRAKGSLQTIRCDSNLHAIEAEKFARGLRVCNSTLGGHWRAEQ